MLDTEYKTPRLKILDDDNQYTCGLINGHNVVLVSLPLRQIGVVNASHLVNPLSRSFPNLRVTLLVGIGGGIPHERPKEDPNDDIHLGDVVIGWPGPEKPSIIQWDSGVRLPNGKINIISALPPPDRRILNTLGKLESNRHMQVDRFLEHLRRCSHHPTASKQFSYPQLIDDRLYDAKYRHPKADDATCSSCDSAQLVPRKQRETANFQIHFGTIVSGSAIVKDAKIRDRLRKELNALCFEMEAAGVLGRQNCLVIRGIADYADSHKNPRWHGYAAATAAAVAREILYIMDPGEIDGLLPVGTF